eukprot:IDg3021t1
MTAISQICPTHEKRDLINNAWIAPTTKFFALKADGQRLQPPSGALLKHQQLHHVRSTPSRACCCARKLHCRPFDRGPFESDRHPLFADEAAPDWLADRCRWSVRPRYASSVRAFQEGWIFKRLAVDGDAGPSTLPEIARCASNGGYASTNFRFVEFKSNGNGDIRVKRALLLGLEKLRARVSRPLSIVSGYRDPAHNRRVGGASNSQHLYGTAADIPYSYATPAVVKSLRAFTGIGIKCGRWVTHVDVRTGSTSSPVTWPRSRVWTARNGALLQSVRLEEGERRCQLDFPSKNVGRVYLNV